MNRPFKIALIMALVLLQSAYAHPHVFIETTSKIVFHEKGLDYIQVGLTWDEMSSANLIQDYDQNEDGLFGLDELLALEEYFKAFKAQNYFADFRLNSISISSPNLLYFEAMIVNNQVLFEYQITYECYMEKGMSLEWSLYDPTYYHELNYSANSLYVEGADHFDIVFNFKEEDESKAYYLGQIFPNVLTMNIQSSIHE